jgi:hypothetical protein
MTTPTAWPPYVDGLTWQKGRLDEATWNAFLRGGTLEVDPQAAMDVVVERIRAAGGRVRIGKLESQLQRAYRHTARIPTSCSTIRRVRAQPGDYSRRTSTRTSTWPSPDRRLIKDIASQGFGLYDLLEGSPIRFDDDEANTEQIVDVLFPGDPLLCVGQTSWQFGTEAREHWRGSLDQYQLIVPCCMTARTGLTREGKESAHCLANTGPRRFQVVEFDHGSLDEQAALLDYLAHRGPLVLAVHSGNKSLHGWFACAGIPEDVLRRFMMLARRLGADLATWRNRSQFVRMPGGTRSNGRRQTIFYFNPQIAL